MSRLIISLLLISLAHEVFCQSNTLLEREKRIAFYPLNIPYAFFGKFQSSIEFPVNSVDKISFGVHYNKKLNYYEGSGAGIEFQYRVNRNRDSNVRYGSISYWGPYFEYDHLKITEYYYQSTGKSYTSLLNIGLLTGNKLRLGRSGLLDLFYGFGLVFAKDSHNDNSYNSTYPFFKAGLQFGIRF